MKNGRVRPNRLFLVLLCVVAAALSAPPAKAEEFVSYTKVGDEVPSFSATTLEGKEINIRALKGKVVLLNFWATWCAPCHAEMPRLEKEIWGKYKDRSFEMVAIAREQTSQEIEEFLKKSKYSFPMSPDPKRAIYAKFANGGIPRNYVINSAGKIVYQFCGYSPSNFDNMLGVIQKELSKSQD